MWCSDGLTIQIPLPTLRDPSTSLCHHPSPVRQPSLVTSSRCDLRFYSRPRDDLVLSHGSCASANLSHATDADDIAYVDVMSDRGSTSIVPDAIQ